MKLSGLRPECNNRRKPVVTSDFTVTPPADNGGRQDEVTPARLAPPGVRTTKG